MQVDQSTNRLPPSEAPLFVYWDSGPVAVWPRDIRCMPRGEYPELRRFAVNYLEDHDTLPE